MRDIYFVAVVCANIFFHFCNSGRLNVVSVVDGVRIRRVATLVSHTNVISTPTDRRWVPCMGGVGCVNVQLHAVVGAGENAEFSVVKELLWEHRNLNHSTGAGILCAQLIVVSHIVK